MPSGKGRGFREDICGEVKEDIAEGQVYKEMLVEGEQCTVDVRCQAAAAQYDTQNQMIHGNIPTLLYYDNFLICFHMVPMKVPLLRAYQRKKVSIECFVSLSLIFINFALF